MVYRKKFHSERFGREIEYFHSWKRGRWGRGYPAIGRRVEGRVRYTQTLVFWLDLVTWIAILIWSGGIGYVFHLIRFDLETSGYIMIGIMIPLLVIYYAVGQPRWIHVKEVRNYLDNNL
ncbi:MAG: hypothetical protein ACMUIG_07905 [Thermoplasmatota archaeon]